MAANEDLPSGTTQEAASEAQTTPPTPEAVEASTQPAGEAPEAATPPTGETAQEQQIVLSTPAPGEQVQLAVIPGVQILLDFDLGAQELTATDTDLIIEFDNGATITLTDFALYAAGDLPPVFMLTDGTLMPGDAIVFTYSGTAIEPAAGPELTSGGAGEYRDDLGTLIEGIDRLGTLDPDSLSAGPEAALEEEEIPFIPENGPPDALDDVAVTDEDTPVTISPPGVLGNDSDPDGDPLTITGYTQPGKGSVSLNPDGSFTFDPGDEFNSLAVGESEDVAFRYTISDGNGGSDTATVTITVNGANDPPVVDFDASDASGTVSEEGLPDANPDDVGFNDTTNSKTDSGQIVFTDADTSDTHTVTLSAPVTDLYSNGTLLTWSGAGTGTLVGSAGLDEIVRVEIDNDGNYTVTLSGPLDHDDETVEDQLSFDVGVTVTDDSGADNATATAAITVTVEDDSPVIGDPQNAVLGNETGNSLTADLDLMFGGDGPAPDALQLSGPTDDGYVVDNLGEFVTADDVKLVYVDDGSGGLIAVKEDDAGYTAFTVSLDAEAGTYTVTIVDGVDGGPVTTEIGLTGGDLQGGNPFVFVKETDLDGDGDSDLTLTATAFILSSDGAVSTPETVNYNNNGMGVGTGASIDGAGLGNSDVLHLEFTDTQSGDPTEISVAEVFLRGFDGETAYWTAISDGNVVASGSFTDADVEALDQQTSTYIIDPGVNFDTLEFQSDNGDGNGYIISAISLTDVTAGYDQTITYTVEAQDYDLDSTSDTFDVTFDGNGYLDGSDEADVLVGTGSGNVLTGGLGDDILTGGDGVDTFVFSGLGGEGTDTISDFVTGVDGDILKITDVLDPTDAVTSVTDDGSDVTVTLNDGSGPDTVVIMEGIGDGTIDTLTALQEAINIETEDGL